MPPVTRYAKSGDVHLAYQVVGEAPLEVEEFLTGIRRGAEPDRVLATILFTDIVDSTTTAASLGDRAWHDLLQAHHSSVRRELARFRGP